MRRWIKRDHKPTTKFDGSEGNYELNYVLPSAATPGPAHDYRKNINNASHFFNEARTIQPKLPLLRRGSRRLIPNMEIFAGVELPIEPSEMRKDIG